MSKKLHNEFGVPHEVFEDTKFKELRISSRVFYVYLCKLRNRYADEKGLFWRSMRTLSDETGMNLDTVKGAKKELKSKGFIEVVRGKYAHKKNRAPDWYRVNGYKLCG